MMIPWLRKNYFIKDLRKLLHLFRVCMITHEIGDEAYFDDQGHLCRSGRQIITIKLTGYWKGQTQGQNLEEEKKSE